jgi:arsenate reductase
MAEGYMKNLAGDRVEAYSAGIEPTSVDLRAIEVMREIGVDISHQKSKSMDEYLQQNFDYIITVR